MSDLDDTIVALSSAPGSGGRAIVRMSGPVAFQIAGSLFSLSIKSAEREVYDGEIRLPGLHSPLAADLYVWPPPRTYTGQELVEIHTVSSPPLIDLLVARCLDLGARAARPGEFTMRAFLAGKLDLTQAEAVHAVIEATDRTDLKHALAQLAGGVSRPLQTLRDDLLDLLAEIEAGLDFAEEQVQFVGQEELLGRLAGALARVTLLQKQLRERGLPDRPFRVVLTGRPNVGKSSLFNALTGEPGALVSPRPGTTRDYLTSTLSLGGAVVELVDTAGWQDGEELIDKQAQGLGAEQIGQADLVVLCLEAGQPITPRERAFLEREERPAVLGVATKCDLDAAPPGLLATSAHTGAGLDDLRDLLAERAAARAQPALAPSLGRCEHHVEACLASLRRAHATALYEEPAEILALELRSALDQLGEMVGAVYTDDLLDRIFSRFCIGK